MTNVAECLVVVNPGVAVRPQEMADRVIKLYGPSGKAKLRTDAAAVSKRIGRKLGIPVPRDRCPLLQAVLAEVKKAMAVE